MRFLNPFLFCCGLLLSFGTELWAQLPEQLAPDSLSVPVGLPMPNLLEIPTEVNLDPTTTVITAAEILERGYDNLDELLASVPGVFLTQNGSSTQIGIRGLAPTGGDNQRVQVLLNGVPLNTPLSGRAPAGYDLKGIAMEDIASVTVIRSPSGVAYGSNAALGVVHIRTQTPQPGLRLNFDTGSFGELDGGFALGTRVAGATLGITGRLARLGQPEDLFPSSFSYDNTSETYGGIGIQLRAGGFSLNANFLRRNEDLAPLLIDPQELEFSSPPPLPLIKESIEIPDNFREAQLFVNLGYEREIDERRSYAVRLFLNYDRFEQESAFRDVEIDPLNGALIGYVDYLEIPQQRNIWAGLNYAYRLRFSARHQLEFGTQVSATPVIDYTESIQPLEHFDGVAFYQTDIRDDVIDYLLDKEAGFDDNWAFWSTAVYAQDRLRLLENLSVDAGLRLDVNSQAGPVLAPRVAVQFTPFANVTALRLGYSRGYRLPSLLETNPPGLAPQLPRPDLSPEYARSLELGLRQRISEGLALNLAVYDQRITDLVTQAADGLPQNDPDSLLRATGLDASLVLDLVNGTKTYFNYNFQFNRNLEINMPTPLCQFGVTIPFWRHFTFFAEGQYEGGRLAPDGNTTLPHFLLNTNFLIRPQVRTESAWGRWLNRAHFAFRVYNLFDEFYQHPARRELARPFVPQLGRTWQSQLTLWF